MGITRVAIAGSSGSIGTQTIEVVLAEPDKYCITALAVGSSSDTVIEQARLLKPELVVVTNEALRSEVATALPGIPVTGNLADVVGVADVVINGVVGFAGLSVTLETLRAGKTLGLANKESLIAAGPVVQPLRATPGAQLVPVDSEHCEFISVFDLHRDQRQRYRASFSPPAVAPFVAVQPNRSLQSQ